MKALRNLFLGLALVSGPALACPGDDCDCDCDCDCCDGQCDPDCDCDHCDHDQGDHAE